MGTLLAEIEAAPWRRTFHAHGRATDTPGHLRNLLGDDADLHQQALRHLHSYVLHQESPFPSAVMTELFVVRMLVEGLVSDEKLRLSLLEFLRYAALTGVEGARYVDKLRAAAPSADEARVEAFRDWLSATNDDEPIPIYAQDRDAFNEELRRCQLEFYDTMPEMFHLLIPLAERIEDATIAAATLAAGELLAQNPQTAADRDAYLAAAERLAKNPDVGIRASAVLSVGRLGGRPSEHLTDPWLIVRCLAALAPALAEDPAALDVLAEAIKVPQAFAAGLAGWPTYPHRVSHHEVVKAACERITDDDGLVPGIDAMTNDSVRIGGSVYCYIQRFFPAGWPSIADQTAGQRRLARFVAGSDRFWNSRLDHHRSGRLQQLELPDDREVWRHLADTSKTPDKDSADGLIVLEAGAAIRRHPHMHFGPAEDGLGQAIVEQLTQAYDAAVAQQIVDSAAITPMNETTFVLSVAGHALPEDRLERILAGAAITDREPLDQLSLTAAMCSEATVTMYAEGRTLVRRFVYGTALGPAVPVDAKQESNGYRIEFTFDPATTARL